jgi:glycosyltransferase involved in cell wall biosynthesis
MPELAVVIGFCDWGLDRLRLALRSHAESDIASDLEVVVSDYGSENGSSVEQVALEGGAVYARTDPPSGAHWSRARALNAGIDRTRAEFVVTTDSDLLFTPSSHRLVLERLVDDPHGVQLLQCRDLSESVQLGDGPFKWDRYERESKLRPRWGMGGMVAFTKAIYEQLGGLEERMEIYGGEDIDFVQRMRWAGKRAIWIDDASARIFHIWHPSSRQRAEQDDRGKVALERNRSILLEDKTLIRNLHRPRPVPVATVVIATHNRCNYLRDSITSVLNSSVENIEVLVVDDGSTDDTAEMVTGLTDPRVRLVRQDHLGVAAARNRAVEEATGHYVVVHDDDDLMLPWRIEAHLDALTAGIHGTYGGWIDFSDDTGELRAVPGKAFSPEAILYTGSVLAHGTLMLDAEVYRHFRYNERLLAGSDYNLVLRLASAGVQLAHSGHFHILRRLHESNLTDVSYAHQKESARKTTNLFIRAQNKPEKDNARKLARETPAVQCAGADAIEALAAPFLPDSLVERSATGSVSNDGEEILRLRSTLESSGESWRELEIPGVEGATTFVVSNLSWAGTAALRDFDLQVRAVVRGPEGDASNGAGVTAGENAEFGILLSRLEDSLPESGAAAVWYVPITSESGEWFNQLGSPPEVVSTMADQYLVRLDSCVSLEEAFGALLAEEPPEDVARFAIDLDRSSP